MQLIRKLASTSNIIRVKLRRTDTGQGLTGLVFGSSGLIISTICDNESAPTTYTATGATIETITTLGTYAAPTATKCRFKEVDATNQPGVYELQIADARFAVSNSKALRIAIIGAALLLDKEIIIQLTSVDVDNTVNMGLTALPAVAAGANGGLPLGDASGHAIIADIDGITHAQAIEVLLAVLSGKSVVSGNTIVYYKRDGTTARCTITYGTPSGTRLTSSL